MNINAPLSIRRRMGLEIFRRLENERTEEMCIRDRFFVQQITGVEGIP